MSVLERPEWHARANCGRNGTIGDDPTARIHTMFVTLDTTVCQGCPVASQCAAAGRHVLRARGAGIWAGNTIGGRVKACEICDTEFYPGQSRTLTCSPECAREKNRRYERERSARARLQAFAAQCCDICGRIRHDPACPNSRSNHRRKAA